MFQPPINSFFTTRKRCASELLSAPSSKKLLLASEGDILKVTEVKNEEKGKIASVEVDSLKIPETTKRRTVVASRTRTLPGRKAKATIQEAPASNSSQENIESNEKKSVELTMKQIQEKVKQSTKLPALKEQLLKLQELEKKRQMLMKQNKTPPKVEKAPEEGQSLKKFDKLDLEVFTSPTKSMRTPTPTKSKPDSELMSPRKGARKMLFSPVKEASSSSAAYEKYAHLVEKTPGLQLPSEYRKLLEIFKACENACYLIRGEITWKKLKPQVALACRKTFNESHLAQIKTIFPEAYEFTQKKTHNYGSITKGPYYQLVITPNVDQYTSQLMTRRQETFRSRLEKRVREEHEKFLQSLQRPIRIDKEKITRWHPEFDLEACPKIEEAVLPRPENEEKFSVAKDVLSGVAKRLFIQEQPAPELPEPPKIPESPVSQLLKRVPASLLEKIRAKEAERAKKAMTRRPSQEAEALTYSRLPALAKQIQNVFWPERKTCLLMEYVIDKLTSSFQENLSRNEFQRLIEILHQEVPEWLSIVENQKVKYVKLKRNVDFQTKLKRLAEEKSVL